MIEAGNSSSEAAIRGFATGMALRNIVVNRVDYVVLAYQNGAAKMANFPSDLSARGFGTGGEVGVEQRARQSEISCVPRRTVLDRELGSNYIQPFS